jgi:hypothetical protein
MRRLPAFSSVCCALLLVAVAQAMPPQYRVEYVVGFDQGQGEAMVSIIVTPQDGRLMRMRFNFDPSRHVGFAGDGRITQGKTRLTWRPPASGPGTLRFSYRIDSKRDNGAFDARITPDWALLRADRMIPPAKVISPGAGESDSTLRFDLPKPWTNADIGYRFDPDRKAFVVRNRGRRFGQPNGWMIARA